MPKFTIDGKEVTVESGTTVFEAAMGNDIKIPHFCYHPKLSIAGNCRMCLVDIEKMPKPQISCNTIVQEGMVVYTKTENVKALQKSVLEFILINHPIDCPVCDQAGECKLQETYMDYTMTDSEFKEAKVKKPKKVDLGPNVILDDERCILCSRCIRFCDEISKTGELCFTERGDRSTLTTFPGKQLDNKYSLNTVDICPVGALTSKPFRFQKRVWFLKSAPAICTGCSNGCNIFLDYDDGKVWRYRTRENEDVNECWTCDEGRLSYTEINENRLIRPLAKIDGKQEFVTPEDALQEITGGLERMGAEGAVFLGSAMESNEDNLALRKLGQVLKVSDLQYSAKEVDNPFSDDFLIKADKNPNRAGVVYLGFKEFSGGTKLKVVLVLNSLSTSHLARLQEEGPVLLVVLASHQSDTVAEADVVLPTCSFAEQNCSFTNFGNRVQKFKKALDPRGQARPAWQWLQTIAEKLGHSWGEITPEKLLKEGFGMNYEELGEGGKVISES